MAVGIDIWTALFVASLAQGLFLLGLLLFTQEANRKASILLMAMLAALIVTNLDYFAISSGLFQRWPQLFGLSNGMMLLFGPLLLFYCRSLLLPDFTLDRRLTWHLIPYAINFVLNLPFVLIEPERKVALISDFIQGQLPLRIADAVVLAIQVAHLSAYLIWVLKILRSEHRGIGGSKALVTDIKTRQIWLSKLAIAFTVYLVLVAGLLIIIQIRGRFDLHANYAYTLVMSAIIYYLAYQVALRKDIVLADFDTKYRSSPLSQQDKARHAAELRSVLAAEKLYLQPDLKLADLADRLQLPAHHLSQLINEEFGQSFYDLVNHYRVEEFKGRLAEPGNAHLSLLGLALEVGFNSKSSFNSAFKKATGLTPSQFKKQSSPGG